MPNIRQDITRRSAWTTVCLRITWIPLGSHWLMADGKLTRKLKINICPRGTCEGHSASFMLWQTLLTWYRGGCGTSTAIKRTNHIRKETLTELLSSLHYYDYMLQLETLPWSCWGSDFGSIQASGVREWCCQFSLSYSETEPPPHKQLGILVTYPPACWPTCLPKYQKSPWSLRVKTQWTCASSCIVLSRGRR